LSFAAILRYPFFATPAICPIRGELSMFTRLFVAVVAAFFGFSASAAETKPAAPRDFPFWSALK
jgi:hypothetical protein